MKRKILITDQLIYDFKSIYRKKFSVDFLKELKSKIEYSKYEAIVVTGGFNTSAKFLKQFKNLKIVSVFGVGYEGVDIKYCVKNNIIVSNTPNILTNDVADLAISLTLSITRNIINGHNHILKNKWSRNNFQLTDSLSNKTVGIVGMGKIGLAVTKRLKCFNMKVVYFGPNKKKLDLHYFNNLEQMAKTVDYLIVTCRGGESTTNLIDKKVINSLKKNAYLINVSRGSVIDETELIKSLKNKKIKGAGLDVFLNEPKINQKFYSLKNVILSPHNASGTKETRLAMARLSNDNIYNYFYNRRAIKKVC